MGQQHRKPLLLLFVLFSGLCLHAQGPTGGLSGRLTDTLGKPLSYAAVRLLRADSSVVRGLLTLEDGRFSFDHLPDGVYRLSFDSTSFEPLVPGPFTIDEAHRRIAIGDLPLRPAFVAMGGVTATARKPLVEWRPDRITLNIENSALATGNTALDLLRRAPGVAIDPDGTISLRGRQGVTVMVDGRPSYLSAEALQRFLAALDGSSIQSIELIPNPSARYEAEGRGGIINIRLKKDRNYGANGNVFIGAGYGRYYKANDGLALNYRTKHVNVFGNYTYARDHSFANTNIFHRNGNNGTQTFFDLASTVKSTTTRNNYNAGIDYFINNRSTLGFSVNGFYNEDTAYARNTTLIGTRADRADSSIDTRYRGHSRYSNTSYHLNYRTALDTLGRELGINADYGRYSNPEFGAYTNGFYSNVGGPVKEPYLFRTPTITHVEIRSGKADYTIPIDSANKLTLGLKSSNVLTSNSYVFEELAGRTWVNNPSYSNHFKYRENITAFYGNLERAMGATKLQLGLRGEQTDTRRELLTDNRIVDRSYFNLFPSVSVNRALSADQDLGFSYSRRIDRPNYRSLNPFVTFVDLYTFQQGNPFLNPQYTNSFELAYSYKKTCSAVFSYSRTRDVITQALYTDTVNKTLVVRDENLAREDAYNLTLSLPWSPAKRWTMYNSITTYYNRFFSPDFMGRPFSSGKLTLLASTTQRFAINTATSVELTAYYQSASVYGTYLVKPTGGVDLGFSRSFANNRFQLKLAANDLFYTNRLRVVSVAPEQDYAYRSRSETRVVRLTFTYRFGSSLIREPAAHSRSTTMEEGRVKPGN